MDIRAIVKSGLVVAAVVSGYSVSAATTLRIDMDPTKSAEVTVGYRQDKSSGLYTTVTTRAGVFHVTQADAEVLAAPDSGGLYFNHQTWTPNDFYTFCTDVGALPPLGNTYTYEAQSLADQTGVNPTWSLNGIYRAAYLYNYWTPQVVMGSLNNAYSRAGLQLAIWETLYDADGNLNDGRFVVNSAKAQVVNEASKFLNAIPQSQTLVATYDSTWLHPAPEIQNGILLQGLLYQDGSFRISNRGGPIGVPDSGLTLTLLGLGFGALGLMGLRKKN